MNAVLKFTHRWLAFVVGAQLFIWVSTGLVFSVIPRKEKIAVPELKVPVVSALNSFSPRVNLSKIQAVAGQPIHKIEFTTWMGKEAVRVDLVGGERPLMLSSDLRQTYPMISEEDAREIALAQLKKSMPISSIERLIAPQSALFRPDYTGEFPVWLIQFSNFKRSRVYVSAVSGDVLQRSNLNKSLFAFALGLHTLAWWQEGAYYNGALITVGLLAWLLTLSGLAMLFRWFWQGLRLKEIEN